MYQMPGIKQIPASEQNIPQSPLNDTNMPYSENMNYKKQKRGEWPYYDIEEVDTQVIKDVEEYHDPHFYEDIGQIQGKMNLCFIYFKETKMSLKTDKEKILQ